MKITIVGDYNWFWYQEALAQEFEKQKHTVFRFSWFDDFRKKSENTVEPVFNSFFKRIEYRLGFGPTVFKINKRLVREIKVKQPDVLFIYNGKLIKNKTLTKIRRIFPKIKIVLYANDNPFVRTSIVNVWKHFLQSIPNADICLAYRRSDFDKYILHGASRVEWFRSYFIEEEDYPVARNTIPVDYKCDVVFAGHFENDGRISALESILTAGYDLKLYGGGWDVASKYLSAGSPLTQLLPVEPAVGENYRFALCGAKVAICFLSTLNGDTYTRRNFQIPAMKVAMLSQYTDDLRELFPGDLDIVFFADASELIGKLSKLIGDDDLRCRIAKAGFDRVWEQQHHLKGRVKDLTKLINDI